MFEDQLLFLADTINSTVSLLSQTFGFMDSIVTYIILLVVDLAFIPILAKSVYEQYAHPHEYYQMPLARKVIMGSVTIIALFIYGYVNFTRFLPAAPA